MVVSTVKLSEMRERTVEELNDEVISMKKKLFQLRIAKSMQKLENTAEISKTKSLVAQLKTIIREKQLAK